VFQRILLAVDIDAAPRHTLDIVTDLARRFAGSVHVLHVVPTAMAAGDLVALEGDEDARRLLEDAVGALRAAGVPAEGELLGDLSTDVPSAVTAAAERMRADLVVLSPHHHGAVAAWLNPSVSKAVTRAVHIPILLIPDVQK
jgi:nucleotide-binding universal stress UspA family protein